MQQNETILITIFMAICLALSIYLSYRCWRSERSIPAKIVWTIALLWLQPFSGALYVAIDRRMMQDMNMISLLSWLAFCAITNLGIFWLYLMVLSASKIDGSIILGMPTMFNIGSNVYRLNLTLFIPFAFSVYGAWLALHCRVLGKISTNFNRMAYLESKTRVSLPISVLSSFNLLVWITGMEGNVFGFLFFLPMIALSIVSAVIYCIHTARFITGKFSHTTESSSL